MPSREINFLLWMLLFHFVITGRSEDRFESQISNCALHSTVVAYCLVEERVATEAIYDMFRGELGLEETSTKPVSLKRIAKALELNGVSSELIGIGGGLGIEEIAESGAGLIILRKGSGQVGHFVNVCKIDDKIIVIDPLRSGVSIQYDRRDFEGFHYALYINPEPHILHQLAVADGESYYRNNVNGKELVRPSREGKSRVFPMEVGVSVSEKYNQTQKLTVSLPSATHSVSVQDVQGECSCFRGFGVSDSGAVELYFDRELFPWTTGAVVIALLENGELERIRVLPSEDFGVRIESNFTRVSTRREFSAIKVLFPADVRINRDNFLLFINGDAVTNFIVTDVANGEFYNATREWNSMEVKFSLPPRQTVTIERVLLQTKGIKNNEDKEFSFMVYRRYLD